MIFRINTAYGILKLSQIITYNIFQKSLVVFTPNITTNHAITCSNAFLNSLRKNDVEDKVEGKGIG